MRLIGMFSCQLRYARCCKHSSFARLRGRLVHKQGQTFDRCCAASDLGSSVDTVVVRRQTASLPTLAVSTGKVRSPRPSRHQSHPFGEYPPKDLECAHRCPPTVDFANIQWLDRKSVV